MKKYQDTKSDVVKKAEGPLFFDDFCRKGVRFDG